MEAAESDQHCPGIKSNNKTYVLWARHSVTSALCSHLTRSHTPCGRWKRVRLTFSRDQTRQHTFCGHGDTAVELHQYCEIIQRRSHTFCESNEDTVESDLHGEGIKRDYILPEGAAMTRRSQIDIRVVQGIKQYNIHPVLRDEKKGE